MQLGSTLIQNYSNAWPCIDENIAEEIMQLERSKQGRPSPRPQRYFVPEINAEVKVERVTEKRYVAHLPDGLERVMLHDMKEWENRGEWNENN
jgi:hypothetical protein